MRPATREEIRDWDELVVANPDGGHILQTRAWGEFKRGHGWCPLYFVLESGAARTAVLALCRTTPLLGELWYLPKGPGVRDVRGLAEAVDELRESPAFAVKMEPELPAADASLEELQRLGLQRARHDVQITRATIVVDLRGEEESLLASFKPKTRYNIRLASRRGVRVQAVPVNERTIEVMYGLMSATRDRAGFTLRPPSYFAGYWRLQEAAGQGQLFFASLGDQVIAGVFATFLGRKGWYKDGGSTKEHAGVMAPHLLQWEVMRFLRRRGVEQYDLVAVPPRDQLRPEHPLYGLYRFKSGFQSDITEFVGTLDLVRDRARFAVWETVVERVEHQWAYRMRHDLLY